MEPRRKGSRGFTLVELLVVITILGMLMGLLFPGVQSAVRYAQMMKCQSQMGQIGKAAIVYDATYGTLPGYHMVLGSGTNASHVGWPVMLLPLVGRIDLWNAWSAGLQNIDPTTGYPPTVRISLFMCPRDPPELAKPGMDGPSSYIANGFIFQDGKGLSRFYVDDHDGGRKRSCSPKTCHGREERSRQLAQLVGFRVRLQERHFDRGHGLRPTAERLRSAAAGRQFRLRQSGLFRHQRQWANLSGFDDDAHDGRRPATRQHLVEPRQRLECALLRRSQPVFVGQFGQHGLCARHARDEVDLRIAGEPKRHGRA